MPARPEPALAARFDEMDAARAAMQALENAGVDGDDIELLGGRAEAARTPGDTEAADRRITRHVGRRLVVGVAIGVTAGALVGAAIGAIVLAATDAVSSESGLLFISVLIGVAIGGVLGAFFGVERSVAFSEDWALTFEDAPEGPLWVAVRTRDRDVVARAREVLEQREPKEVRAP